ncbi:MAG: COG1361 family protein [Dehalococcoidia bacterium]
MRRLLISLPIALLILIAIITPRAAYAESVLSNGHVNGFGQAISTSGQLFPPFLAQDNTTLPDGLALTKGSPFITPFEANKGDPVTIKVQAQNTSQQQISYSLAVQINGKAVGTPRMITLDAGQSNNSIIFQINAEDAGLNDVRVGNLMGSFTVKDSGSFLDLPPYLWAFFGIVLGVIIMLTILMVTKPSKRKPGAQGEQLKKGTRQKGKPGKPGMGDDQMQGGPQRPGMAGMPEGMFPMGMQAPGQPGMPQDMSAPGMPGMQQPFQQQPQPGMQQPFQQPGQPGMQPPGMRGPQFPGGPQMHPGGQPPMQGMPPGQPMGPGMQPPFQPGQPGGQPGMPFGMQRPQQGMPPGVPGMPPPGQQYMQPGQQPMTPPMQSQQMPQGMGQPGQPGMQPPAPVGAGPMSMPKFSVSNLTITPNKVKVGEPVNISIIVSNNGMQTGKYSVVLRVGGVVENISDLSLPPGASQTAGFTVVKDVAGDYYADIDGLGGFFTAIPLAPPSFIVSNFSIGPERVRQGAPVIVTASVTNVGEVTGSHTLILRVKGLSESQQEISLGPGKMQNVEFQIVKDTPGFYPVALENWTGKFVVEMDWNG